MRNMSTARPKMVLVAAILKNLYVQKYFWGDLRQENIISFVGVAIALERKGFIFLYFILKM